MIEIEIEKKESEGPSIEVLDKAFEILKSAGFPQDMLDKAYGMLKSACGEKEMEVEKEITIEKKGSEVPMDSSKKMMMEGMRAFMEKFSK